MIKAYTDIELWYFPQEESLYPWEAERAQKEIRRLKVRAERLKDRSWREAGESAKLVWEEADECSSEASALEYRLGLGRRTRISHFQASAVGTISPYSGYAILRRRKQLGVVKGRHINAAFEIQQSSPARVCALDGGRQLLLYRRTWYQADEISAQTM